MTDATNLEAHAATADPTRDRPVTLTVFFLLRATATWLAKTPAQRHAFVDEVLRPLLARRPGVRLRYFDAEAYSARTSDVLMWEVRDERAYRALVEDLRETPFWGRCFEVRDIIPAVEDGFARHYGVAGVSGAPPAGHARDQ
ncbi:MAG: darcynin family protein [Myxococcota bacterium]